jgi:DNA-binding GntR family transcriptional regulator
MRQALVRKEDGPAATGAERVAELVRLLRDRISSRAIEPLSPLREEALAQEFDTSRAYVREALSSLEQRGLVERIPKFGARVAKLEVEDAIHIYETREALEGQCVRLAVLKSKPSDWKSLQARFERAVTRFEMDGSVEDYLAAIDEFRLRTMERADNPVLRDCQEMMLDRSRLIIRRVAILPGRPRQGMQEHLAVMQGMVEGDADRAADLARENIRSALQFLLRYKSYLF